MKTIARFVLVAAACITTVGCTHAMHVKNIDDYQKVVAAPRRLTIALRNSSTTTEGQELYDYVAYALRAHPDVAQVVSSAEEADGGVPDAIVTVDPNADFHGMGRNFFITFPGFLVFAHAWNGFAYTADVRTRVDVASASATVPMSRDIRTKYDMRHCDFGRGAAASSGWYLPGWGGTNLIVGLLMMTYDDDATPEFNRNAGPAYGNYIANSIVEMVTDTATAGGAGSDRISSACARFDAGRGVFVGGCGVWPSLGG